MNKWIAVDWGTTSFRAYLIKNNIVSDRIETKDGMKFINNNSFEKTFISLVENWLDDYQTIEVLASGMVGARQGWSESPYQETPCNLNNIKFISPLINFLILYGELLLEINIYCINYLFFLSDAGNLCRIEDRYF